MNTILKSLSVIIGIAAIAGGITWSLFSDSIISSGNTFAAGEMALTVDGKSEDSQIAHVTFNNVVPAVQWHGPEYNHQWVLKNVGSVPGHVTYTIKNVRNYENGCNNPEVTAGDTSCDTGSNQGELGQQIKLLFQLNQTPWGTDQEIYPLNSKENIPHLAPLYHLNPGETKNVYLRSWLIDATNNNLVQGDQVEFDIEFTLESD